MRRMNKLPVAKRVQILSMLCEGSSMRSIERIVESWCAAAPDFWTAG
jgi:hypothetical protein